MKLITNDEAIEMVKSKFNIPVLEDMEITARRGEDSIIVTIDCESDYKECKYIGDYVYYAPENRLERTPIN